LADNPRWSKNCRQVEVINKNRALQKPGASANRYPKYCFRHDMPGKIVRILTSMMHISRTPERNLSLLALSALLLLAACDSAPLTETITMDGASAHWVAPGLLIWDTGFDLRSGENEESFHRFEIRYSNDASIRVGPDGVTGGTTIALQPGGELSDELSDRFRHISGRQVFVVDADTATVRDALRGQIVAIAYGRAGEPVAATRVQHAGVIDALYTSDATPGPVYDAGNISLSIWAPTAIEMSLKIYDEAKNPVRTIPAEQHHPSDGVWRFRCDLSCDRAFYRLEVTVYHHENDQINTWEVTDPYSVSLSTDSRFSQFADLAGDPDLKPAGWDGLVKTLPRAVDITLYEAHIRDFSITDRTVPGEHRGTYLAFTYNGENGRPLSKGMAHLKRLADAGLTHLHLLPVNDIATVREDRTNRVDLDDPYERICELIPHESLRADCERYGDTPVREVFERLAADDPATDQIQRPYDEPGRYNGMAAADGFNWGYDPFHFNSPEGSYATDPEGVVRIRELREMVMALHEIGLRVVVDVVYNHTFASGLSRFSVLDKVVPGYYHRYDPDSGAMETSTCCDNTAAENAMMEKLIIDSVLLWARHYKIDAFRFDLMGHHPRYVMENLQAALAQLVPERDGVDGRNIYIYGEGWDFGEVAGNRIFEQATQFNMGGTGIGNFNDRLRDGVRGGNFTDRGRFQGFANGQYLFPNEDAGHNRAENLEHLLSAADRIRLGMAGNLSSYRYVNRRGDVVLGINEMIGFTHQPRETINYIDKHDNETLWDNTQTKLPLDMGMDDRIRIHMLSNAFVTFGQGVPFYQMGSDILRSKSLDRNSFDSGDWFNAVDFSLETHNWGIGLPPGWDNRNRWDEIREFLSRTELRPSRSHMEKAHQVFLEQLRIRYSTPLFRLETAGEIHMRVAFHNTGADQHPGLIVMSISDGACAGAVLDENIDGVLVLFNASPEPVSFDTGISGLRLHPVQQLSADPVIREARADGSTVHVPAHVAAVFVRPAGSVPGDFPCNPHQE
jgi:pullulanase